MSSLNRSAQESRPRTVTGADPSSPSWFSRSVEHASSAAVISSVDLGPRRGYTRSPTAPSIARSNASRPQPSPSPNRMGDDEEDEFAKTTSNVPDATVLSQDANSMFQRRGGPPPTTPQQAGPSALKAAGHHLRLPEPRSPAEAPTLQRPSPHHRHTPSSKASASSAGSNDCPDSESQIILRTPKSPAVRPRSTDGRHSTLQSYLSDTTTFGSGDNVATTFFEAGGKVRRRRRGNSMLDVSSGQTTPVQSNSRASSFRAESPLASLGMRQYTVHRNNPLGAGACGTVYKGYDNIRGDHVAVKVSNVGKVGASDLEAEFNTLTALQHENIVAVRHFELNAQTGEAQVVMEWMPSGSVQSILEARAFRLHETVVRRYFKEALLGLAYLHANKVIHRDIKTGNMLVGANGQVKISDFGTSRLLAAGDHTATTAGVVGTPAYMAPEVITKGRTSKRSDVWATACAVVEMATGKMPWCHLPKQQRTHIPLMFHIGSVQPPNHHPRLPRYASAELVDILTRCFAFKASERPTAAALLDDPYFGDDLDGLPPPGCEDPVAYERELRAHLERGGCETDSDDSFADDDEEEEEDEELEEESSDPDTKSDIVTLRDLAADESDGTLTGSFAVASSPQGPPLPPTPPRSAAAAGHAPPHHHAPATMSEQLAKAFNSVTQHATTARDDPDTSADLVPSNSEGVMLGVVPSQADYRSSSAGTANLTQDASLRQMQSLGEVPSMSVGCEDDDDDESTRTPEGMTSDRTIEYSSFREPPRVDVTQPDSPQRRRESQPSFDTSDAEASA